MENRNLWEILFAELRKQDDREVMFQFCLISRVDNKADPYAKAGTFTERKESMCEVV